MRRPLPALCVALALLACGHTTPFTPGGFGTDQPFASGSPRRLTFNTGNDRTPAWLPADSAIIYSLQRLDRPDRDRCLAVLPRDGGRIETEVCDRDPAADDSTDAFADPAAAADGRLAYVLASSLPADIAPRSTALVLGTLAAPYPGRTLLTLPYFGPDRTFRNGISHVQWLGPDALVFVGERVGYHASCRGCPVDTLPTGLEVARLDLSGPSPGLAVLPGTGLASSVAAGESADVLYYTVSGDSRVFRRVVSSGTDSVVWDFGSAGIARDVSVTSRWLAAVVGGAVSFAYDSALGYPVQRDLGGGLHLVDRATGADSVFGAGLAMFRRPALAAGGTRLVAEAYPIVINDRGDTLVAAVADLWEFDLP